MGLFETAKSNAESFMIAIKELINSASFNKSFRATVTEKINNTVYKVSYKNAEYKVKSYYDLLVGDLVWVCAPGNDWDSLFVQSYNGFHDRVITTDKVVNNLTTNVAGTVLDGRIGKSLKSEIDNIKSTPGIFSNYGVLLLSSQDSSSSSAEGSQIEFKGRGGNSGNITSLDCYNNIFRIFGNFNGTSLKVYEFRSDGIYLSGTKITN